MDARGTPVTLSIADGRLWVAPEDEAAFAPFVPFWDAEEILADGHFRVRLRGIRTGVLEGRDPALSRWLRDSRAVAPSMGPWPRGLAWAAAVAALCLGLYWIALPALARAALDRIPRSWDVKVGEEALRYWLPEGVDSPPTGKAGEAVARGQAFLDSLGAGTGIAFKLHWLPDSSVVNAFALPGGDILLYQGLVLEMKDPSELLGVLAHEAGHVVERHGMNGVVRAGLVGLLAGAAMGDAGGGVSVLLGHAATLAQLSYGRRQEAAADAFALRALAARGQSCDGLEKMFRNGVGADVPDWARYFVTHPADGDRVRALAKLRRDVPACRNPGPAALSRADLRALQSF